MMCSEKRIVLNESQPGSQLKKNMLVAYGLVAQSLSWLGNVYAMTELYGRAYAVASTIPTFAIFSIAKVGATVDSLISDESERVERGSLDVEAPLGGEWHDAAARLVAASTLIPLSLIDGCLGYFSVSIFGWGKTVNILLGSAVASFEGPASFILRAEETTRSVTKLKNKLISNPKDLLAGWDKKSIAAMALLFLASFGPAKFYAWGAFVVWPQSELFGYITFWSSYLNSLFLFYGPFKQIINQTQYCSIPSRCYSEKLYGLKEVCQQKAALTLLTIAAGIMASGFIIYGVTVMPAANLALRIFWSICSAAYSLGGFLPFFTFRGACQYSMQADKVLQKWTQRNLAKPSYVEPPVLGGWFSFARLQQPQKDIVPQSVNKEEFFTP